MRSSTTHRLYTNTAELVEKVPVVLSALACIAEHSRSELHRLHARSRQEHRLSNEMGNDGLDHGLSVAELWQSPKDEAQSLHGDDI